jgi:hypothetical protein
MTENTNERYILFMTQLIPAVRGGYKTETRRIMNPQPESIVIGFDQKQCDKGSNRWNGYVRDDEGGTSWTYGRLCPYGVPGEILLVKESYALAKEYDDLPASKCPPEARERIWYSADGEKPAWAGRTRSSRFAPRWAIRTRLMVDEIRVERLQDITDAGAKAEGIRGWTKDGSLYKYGLIEPGDEGVSWSEMKLSPREAFCNLWDYVNGKNGHEWAKNEWVFVIKYHLIEDTQKAA